LLSLTLRLAAASAAVLGMMITIFATGYNLSGYTWGNRPLNEFKAFGASELWPLLIVVGFSVLAGVLIRFAFAHRSRRISLLILIVLELVTVLLFDGIIELRHHVMFAGRTYPDSYTLIADFPILLVVCFLVAAIIADAGSAIGSAALVWIRRIRKNKTQRVLRRCRRRRHKRGSCGAKLRAE
jgi:predicted MFS family arabinose efflux permease